MRRCLFFAVVLGFGAAACAPHMPTPDTGPETCYERFEATATDEANFEVLPKLQPAQLLPPDLLRSEHHSVEGVTSRNGFTHTYHVVSDFGELEVEGIGLLRQRVHELGVLAALRDNEVESEKVYVLAVLNAAEGPLEGASQFLVHPVKTTSGIPKGMWAYARVVAEMTRRRRTYLEDHYGEELLGLGKTKREWAARLGVDAYSTNPALQEALNRYGWLSLAGGLTVRAPLMAVPGSAAIALTVSSTGDDMKRELRDMAPEDIRILNRQKLRAMQIAEPLLAHFLRHPWYSPTRQLTIVGALANLEPASNRGEFIEAASGADEPEETFVFTRMALMLASYHRSLGRIEEIMAPGGLVMARAKNRNIVVPLYLDLGFWTRSMAKLADDMESSLPEDCEIGQRVVLISGRLSARARSEFMARGWTPIENLELTWLAEHDARTFEPGKPDEDRILPEIGS